MLIALLSANLSFATSLTPCTPIVPAKAIKINCLEDSKYYSILINTLMSSRDRGCTGSKYYEYKTADIKITDKQGHILESLNIGDGDFSYNLTQDNVHFSSPINGLKLTKCVTAVYGGVSIGN